MNIIIIFLLVILFFFIKSIKYNLLTESFAYFNLNYETKLPLAFNTEFTKFDKINMDISNNQIKFTPSITNDANVYIFLNRMLFKNVSNYFNNPDINKDINTSYIKSNRCCLIKKKLDNGKFTYDYTPLKNEECDINLYELDQNNELLFDGINNWSNEYCSNNIDSQILGSCRRINFECKDFIIKENCQKYPNKMKWNKKTCNDRIF